MPSAKFLDNAKDVEAFAKLPQPFGFFIEYTDGGMNLRSYYPDFVAVDDHGVRWLLKTKGAETDDVAYKDAAAKNFYFVDPAKLHQFLGVSWTDLRNGVVNTKLVTYLEAIEV